jgi:putative ABC transport system permease protein
MVLVQGLKLVAIGLVLGGIAAVALGSSVRTLLFDTEPTDIATYLGVAIVLGIVALGARLMPARRASSVDLLVVLRGTEDSLLPASSQDVADSNDRLEAELEGS